MPGNDSFRSFFPLNNQGHIPCRVLLGHLKICILYLVGPGRTPTYEIKTPVSLSL